MKCICYNDSEKYLISTEKDTQRQIDILSKDWNYTLKVPFMNNPIIMDLYVYMGVQTSESNVVIDRIDWSANEKVFPYKITFKMDQLMDIDEIIQSIKYKLSNL